ncbi:MAG: winged helix-turn-helix transcriptional regulator [Chitinophagaceae bacterium]|nr:winged helix-turn-helix transcriptional regulator [Rubrivivax sp.]
MKHTLDTAGVDHLVGFWLAVADVPGRRVFRQHIGQPFELKPVEFTLLMLLLVNPGVSPKQLVPALRVPAPQVTLLVDRLAQRELVERRRNARDGRALHLMLTAKGQALAEKVHRLSLGMEQDWLQVLSPGERVMLRELLMKLTRASAD